MVDIDDFDSILDEAHLKLDKLLAFLQGCDLREWDQDFVDDLTKRLERRGNRLTVTPLQDEQLERMKDRYGFKER